MTGLSKGQGPAASEINRPGDDEEGRIDPPGVEPVVEEPPLEEDQHAEKKAGA